MLSKIGVIVELFFIASIVAEGGRKSDGATEEAQPTAFEAHTDFNPTTMTP